MLTASRLSVQDASANNRVYRWRERVGQPWLRWQSLQARARQRGVPFSLTPGQIDAMLSAANTCPALGIPLQKAAKAGSDNAAEIDCFFPELGYVPENVHVISRRANRIKSDATIDEILMLADWMRVKLGR